MKNRSKAYYRYQRQLIIRRRYKTYRQQNVDIPLENLLPFSQLLRQPGRFSKYNLSCNCMLCKGEKRLKVRTKQDLMSLLSFQEQLEEYELDKKVRE